MANNNQEKKTITREERIVTFAKAHGFKNITENPIFKHRLEVSKICGSRSVDTGVGIDMLRHEHPDYGIQPGHVDEWRKLERLYIADPELNLSVLYKA